MTITGFALAAAVVLAGCAAPLGLGELAHSARWVEVAVDVGATPGHRVLDVAHAEGVTYIGAFNLTVGHGPHPWVLLFVHSNGTVDVLSHWMYSNAHWGQGRGVAYAGGAGAGVSSPTVLDAPLPLVGEWSMETGSTRGQFIIAWTGFLEPGEFTFTFTPGARVREVAAGAVGSFDLVNFDRGVSAGVVPLVGAGAGLAADLEPVSGHQKFGLVSTYSNEATFGGARVVLENGTIDLPFPGVCGASCNPLRFRSALFATSAPAAVEVDWAGNHRNTRVTVIHLDLPSGILPDLVHVFEPPT